MDIHRCRFVPYPPSTINALAFSHSHVSKDQKNVQPRLALGRANGDIEIWNPLNGAWFQEVIIRGGKDRSVDGLVWTQDSDEEDVNGRVIPGRSRLFSIGYTTTVTEWDLERGRPLRQASGNHGEIWCLAAQPATDLKSETNGSTATSQHLVTGCTDGALVLYSTADEDLQLKGVLVRPSSRKAKIISVVFQDRNVVIAGCTDSTIRVFDIRNGSTLRTMTLGAGPKGGPKEIIVWSVKTLPNGNIVSADSTGEIRIWDGKTYTLMQRIKGHRQDVLSLATSFDGSVIFSGGMDRRTVIYKQSGKGGRWAEVAHRRYHTHDVKTMATLEGKGISVVVSGGPDASPTVLPLKHFGTENQRALPFLPQEPTIQSAPKSRLLMAWWDREVHIWRLKNSHPSETEDSDPESTQNRKLVAKILIKGEANINSAAITQDGSLLAVASSSDVKVFHLRPRRLEEGDGLRVSKLTLPASLSSGARTVQFSPDGKWLCIIRENNRIALTRVLDDGKAAASSIGLSEYPVKLERLHRQIEKNLLLGGLGAYDRTIIRVSFSSDSKILAVGDIAGYIDTWALSGQEDLTRPEYEIASNVTPSSESSDGDSEDDDDVQKVPQLCFGQHWTRNPAANLFPKLTSSPVILSFRPATVASSAKATTNNIPHTPSTRHNPAPVPHGIQASEDRLLIVTAKSQVYEFSALSGSLTTWSKRNLTARFPEEFRKLKDQARGCVWDVNEDKERLWLYGIGWLWMLDLSRDFPESSERKQVTNGQTNGSLITNGENMDLVPQNTPGKKRKRIHNEDLKRAIQGSGAGGRIPDNKLGTGISRTMQRNLYTDDGNLESSNDIDLVDEMDLDRDDDAEVDGEISALGSNEAAAASESTQLVVASGVPQWWHTYKYRPILGIVPIGEGSEEGTAGPEVALVERPIWEVDLPPRYYGDHE
ncbi:WD40-repeat-containing domain protein [Xylogone sp. PMI_703]|nr:WD40-repeat-containing domain protein [Xylogone sp. PMI_703]